MESVGVHAFFKGMCPNCEGEISDLRLSMSVPCNTCLPISDNEVVEAFKTKDFISFRKHVLALLKKYGTLKNYEEKLFLDVKVEELDRLFSRVTQSRLWSAQRTWAKRLLSGKSFTIVAPTGMGKTVFGIFVSLYLARKGLRCYIMLPTTLLVQQVSRRLLETIKSLKLKIPVATYHSLLSKKEAEEELKKIKDGNFRILITTSTFIVKRFDLLKDKKFDFLFVDDVDAFLKSSKNIDKVLLLLGFEEKIIENAFQLIRLRSEFGRALRQKSEAEAVNKLRESILEIEREIEKFTKKNKVGILVVSGASIRARRTKRVKLFKELLGFEVTSKFEVLRNIEDLYLEAEDLKQGLLKVLRVFDGGGLIFVPMDKGAEFAEEISNFLVENGIKATIYKKQKRLIQDYVDGKYDVLVGVASPRSPLVRGLDLPERIRYVVFAGVPKFKISLDIKEFRPEKARILLANLRDFLSKEEQDKVDKYLLTLRRYSTMLRREEVLEIAQAMIEKRRLPGFLGNVQTVFEEISNFLEDILEREEVKKKIEESPHLSSETVEGRLHLIIPDSVAYVQGSGRASRMYIGKISKGASVVIVDDKKAFNGLVRELRWFIEDLEWKRFDEADLKSLLKEIDADRENIRRIREGRITPEFKDLTKTALLVVESPNKARTIARFFGRPSRRIVDELTVYEVNTGDLILNIAATGGHVFDLVTTEGFHGVRMENGNFFSVYSTIKKCKGCGEQVSDEVKVCPVCGSELEDKIEIVKSLQQVAREVDLILVGTDADAEGEKIGYDVSNVLLNPNKERIEFHEITKKALSLAIKNPRELDRKMVEAQIVRRVEDRWLGFELSRKLWEKFGSSRLSAGRVQTPVLGWIIQRAIESRKSVKDFYILSLENGLKVSISLPPEKEEKVKERIEEFRSATCKILPISEEEVELNPQPPFSTDTMLREASGKLKLGVGEIMRLAQDLFELGLITYHRTDSVRVSTAGIGVAKEYIQEKFGEEVFRGREWFGEGAHECIRPTRPMDVGRLRQLLAMGILRLAKPLTAQHLALYNLIFNRFIASQMKPAKALKLKFKVSVKGFEVEMEGYKEVIEKGFTLIKPLKLLPSLKPELKVLQVTHKRMPTILPYTEGEIIETMRKNGIGRPSTYAKIVNILFERKYVKETKGKRVVPTKLGYIVYNYLSKKFSEYVSEETTRKLEEVIDAIEAGKLNYQEVLSNLYEEVSTLKRS